MPTMLSISSFRPVVLNNPNEDGREPWAAELPALSCRGVDMPVEEPCRVRYAFEAAVERGVVVDAGAGDATDVVDRTREWFDGLRVFSVVMTACE